MRFEDLSWMDVESYLQQDDRVILITGATEQHGYLSLLSDIVTPTKLALAAAEREHVLIAPSLNFGVSSMFITFPGTISLSREVYNLVLTEIVQGLLAHGFAGFFILNGHGGNQLPPQVEDIRLDGQARILWHDWWKSPVMKAFEAEHGLRLDHANWGDNFRFNRVGPVPEGVKPPINLGYLEAGQSARELLGDGSYGGPYQIDDALMDILFERLVDEIAGLLSTLKNH